MIEVIADAGLKGRQQIGRDPTFQCVCAKGP